jgi:hypothetical protein
MRISFKAVSRLAGAGIAIVVAVGVDAVAAHGDAMAAMAGMTAGEISTLHAALFLATVWIVSSLRIHRLKALWRVGLGRKALRGASGSLQPRGPKARVAAGGSVGGAGASGNTGSIRRAGDRRRHAAFANDNDNGAAHQLLDNFRG